MPVLKTKRVEIVSSLRFSRPRISLCPFFVLFPTPRNPCNELVPRKKLLIVDEAMVMFYTEYAPSHDPMPLLIYIDILLAFEAADLALC